MPGARKRMVALPRCFPYIPAVASGGLPWEGKSKPGGRSHISDPPVESAGFALPGAGGR